MQGTRFLRQAVACQPHGIATITGDRRRTWTEVGERVPRLASALREMGIADGAFVAALGFNSDRYVELFFATPWAGGAFAPLNIRWSLAENAYALKNSQASVLFVDESFVDQALELKRELGFVKTLVFMGEGETPEGMLSYEQLVAVHEPMEDANRSGEDLWVIFYTAGTTSHPKGVMMSHRGLFVATLGYLAMLPDIEDLKFLYVAGFFHFAGASALLYITMVGGTHVLLPKFEPVPVMRAISEHRVTNMVLVPDHDQFADSSSGLRALRPLESEDLHLRRLADAGGADSIRDDANADLAVLPDLRHDGDRRIRQHVALAGPYRLGTEGPAPSVGGAARARQRGPGHRCPTDPSRRRTRLAKSSCEATR